MDCFRYPKHLLGLLNSKNSNVLHEGPQVRNISRSEPLSERFFRVNIELAVLEHKVRTDNCEHKAFCLKIAFPKPRSRSVIEGNELLGRFEPRISLMQILEVLRSSDCMLLQLFPLCDIFLIG